MAKVSMDILIEALFQAVLSEENKPLSVRRRQVKDRILEAEGAIRQWTKPKLSDPNNERVLLEFRKRLRQRLERGSTQAIGGTASYLIDVFENSRRDQSREFQSVPPSRIANSIGLLLPCSLGL
jgi:hypothetical protein